MDKLNMTAEEIVAGLVRICYRLIERFSKENATPEEKSMLPALMGTIIRLLDM